MTSPHACTCGYEATSAEDLRDHLREIFTPDDDRAPDGQLHSEAAGDPARDPAAASTARGTGSRPGRPGTADNSRALACLCGYAASGIADLDAHLADVFTPADRVGRDGLRHVPAAASLIGHALRWELEELAPLIQATGNEVYPHILTLYGFACAYITVDVGERFPTDADLRALARNAADPATELPVTEAEVIRVHLPGCVRREVRR